MRQPTNQWAALLRIANALYERESSKLTQIIADQAELTQKNARLDEMNDAALKDLQGPHPAHWHDGEVLWQKWVGQNKRKIGIEDARLRGIRELHLVEMKKAFGRKEVLREIQENACKDSTGYG